LTNLLEGRTAIVTGAARGIGFAIACTFRRHGANVLLADIDHGGASAAAAALHAPDSVAAIACDVTRESDVTRMIEAAHDLGGVDVVVNNAGITRDASLKRMTISDFDAVLEVHLRGTWLVLRAASSAMRDGGSGSIINLSSLSGKAGNPGQTNYSAAKAGIVGMTKAAAKELAHHGIRVNAIQPGLIRTDMTAAMEADVLATREQEIPMRRLGEPSEVANVALFLASELSSYVTGTAIEVGGGRYM
jgi:3-oxoacyl-[acyl-carrier protein] reductase